MARPIDPIAQYRVSIHNIGGYRYASTQPAYQDPETGKTKHRRIHPLSFTSILFFEHLKKQLCLIFNDNCMVFLS